MTCVFLGGHLSAPQSTRAARVFSPRSRELGSTPGLSGPCARRSGARGSPGGRFCLSSRGQSAALRSQLWTQRRPLQTCKPAPATQRGGKRGRSRARARSRPAVPQPARRERAPCPSLPRLLRSWRGALRDVARLGKIALRDSVARRIAGPGRGTSRVRATPGHALPARAQDAFLA